MRLQKIFLFPIQFNGWVTLDNVANNFAKCAQDNNEQPQFFLEDDHNGSVALTLGEKVYVGLEKLYEVRVEYPNQGLCKTVDVEFGVLYGTNE